MWMSCCDLKRTKTIPRVKPTVVLRCATRRMLRPNVNCTLTSENHRNYEQNFTLRTKSRLTDIVFSEEIFWQRVKQCETHTNLALASVSTLFSKPTIVPSTL